MKALKSVLDIPNPLQIPSVLLRLLKKIFAEVMVIVSHRDTLSPRKSKYQNSKSKRIVGKVTTPKSADDILNNPRQLRASDTTKIHLLSVKLIGRNKLHSVKYINFTYKFPSTVSQCNLLQIVLDIQISARFSSRQ